MTNDPPVLVAEGLELHTRRGHVFGPIDLKVGGGELAMLVGPAGSGKTAALLALGARMRPSSGSLRIGGVDAIGHAATARRRAAFGLVAGVNDLAGSLSVRDTVRRELTFVGGSVTPAAITRVLSRLDPPIDPAMRVGELAAGQRCALGIALAAAAGPAVLLVDAIDAEYSPAERVQLLALLRTLADTGIAVVASCVDPATARDADVAITMRPVAEGEVTDDAVA